MNAQLNYMLAQQRSRELRRSAEQAPPATELARSANRVARVSQHRQKVATRFTLRGHHIAKLDRFLGQAQRAALRAEREFDGVSIEINAEGVASVHGVGMTPMVL